MALTLLDIAKLTGNDAVVGLIEENLNVAPEVSLMPMRTIKGTSFQTVFRKTEPVTYFRNANEAATASQSTWDNARVECKILGGLMVVDKAVAKAHEDGPEALMAMESDGIVRSSLQKIGRQIFYGGNTTYSGDAKGFKGLLDVYDATNMVIDATGTTATTGSSVWLVKTGPQWAQLLAGNGGAFDFGPWREELYNGIDSFVNTMTSWVGFQALQPRGIVRIKKLTADSGKGLTDALIHSALALFPTGVMPDYIFMSRRSAWQLASSRTVSATYRQQSAPAGGDLAVFPTSAAGIPVVVTDSISNVEALTL